MSLRSRSSTFLSLCLFVAFFTGFGTPEGYGQVEQARQLSKQAYNLARSAPDSSIKIAEQALALAQKMGSVHELARAHAVLGRSHIMKSNLAGLHTHVRAGMALVPFLKNDTLKADLYNLQALSYRFLHKPDSAMLALQACEQVARKGKMRTQLTNVLTAKGALLSDKRQYAAALAAYEECYQIDTRKADPTGQALDLQNIGLTQSHLKLYQEALITFRRALPLQQSQNDKHGLVRTLLSISTVFAATKAYDSADVALTKAYALAQSMGDALAQGAIANNMSSYAYERGLYEQTKLWAQRSIAHYAATGDTLRAAGSLGNLGELARRAGQLPKAAELLEKSVAFAKALKEGKVLAQSTRMLAHVYTAQGQHQKAAQLMDVYASLQDSLYKQNLAEAVATTEGRHEAFVKDQQIALLNKDLQLQNLSLKQKDLLMERGTLLAVLVALMVAAAGGFVYLTNKRKQLRQEAAHQKALRQEQADKHTATLEAEELERKRIARELHDGVGQMLASIRLHMAARAHPQMPTADLEAMLAEASDEVRFISHNLLPQALARKGLDAALLEFADRLARTKNLRVQHHLEPVQHVLSATEATMLYRMVQELASNALKHAQAQSIYLTLTLTDQEVCLVLEDDGVGFDPTTLADGIGLANLQARIASVHGHLELDSQPGRGTVCAIHIPTVLSTATAS